MSCRYSDMLLVHVRHHECLKGISAVVRCLIEIPYNLAQTFVFSCISYFFLGFDHTAGERSCLHPASGSWVAAKHPQSPCPPVSDADATTVCHAQPSFSGTA